MGSPLLYKNNYNGKLNTYLVGHPKDTIDRSIPIFFWSWASCHTVECIRETCIHPMTSIKTGFYCRLAEWGWRGSDSSPLVFLRLNIAMTHICLSQIPTDPEFPYHTKECPRDVYPFSRRMIRTSIKIGAF